jgi:hypothetical protein
MQVPGAFQYWLVFSLSENRVVAGVWRGKPLRAITCSEHKPNVYDPEHDFDAIALDSPV